MRKFFLLIPLLSFALLANAAVTNIDNSTPDALRLALHNASDGDIIEMAGGIYEESNSNYIAFNAKSVIVRAAAGQNVIIKPHVPFTVSGGARAEIQNVKIDASELCSLSSYSHLMYPSDNTANNRLILDGCEVYGYVEGKAVIASRGSNKLDSLIINNCKFYNHTTRSCIFMENTENKGLIVTNSTFYNIATGTADFNAGIIDNRNADAKVRIDHCTFYNVIPMNTDYSCVSKISLTDGIVSNCIFMLPSAQDGVRAMRGVTANNCLTYNYIKDSNTGIHSSVTKNNCFQADPLFANAASGDFSLAGNWVTMTLSPARGAATDGSDLGDPRWAVAETLPTTDFATPYVFLGEKAILSGSFALNGDNYIQSQDKSYAGIATWKIEAERKCFVEVTLNIAAANTSGHRYKVALYDSDNNLVGTALEEPSNSWSAGDKVLGSYEIPAAGNYIIKLTNDCANSSTIIEGVTFTYLGGAVQTIPGTTNVADAWFSSNGTRADGKISYSSISSGCWAKWNIAITNAGTFNVTVNISGQYGHDYSVEFLKEGETTPIVVTKGAINYTNDPTLYANELGSVQLEAGNYEMKVSNAVGDAALHSVTLTYEGGALVSIPGSLSLTDAILSTRAFIDAEGLHFTDNDHLGTISGEWAKWNINVAATGVYTFTAHCNSTNYSNLTIAVYDGETELYTFTPQYTYNQADKEINSPEWLLEAGNYVLKLSNPANNSNGYLLSLAASQSDIIVLDEQAMDNSVIHANNGVKDKKILLKRTFVAGMYNTICLPFSDWDSSLKLIFGEGYELLELESAVLEGDVLNLNFTPVTSLGHGRPYLIKPTQDVVNPIFGTNHTIDERTDGYNIMSSTNANFIGTFIKGTIPAGEDNLFLGQNNLLYFSDNDTPIKGMRAYFQVKGVPHPSQAIRHANIIANDQVVTSIDFTKGENNKVMKAIENGQLIIIRNGVRFTVQGQRIQ